MKKKLIGALAMTAFLLGTPITILANPVFQDNSPSNWQNHQQTSVNVHPSHGLNRNGGHFGPPAPNDFHTPMWNRFDPPNYNFSSGPNYRYVLGRPTYAANWQRPQSMQNHRVDAQGSFRPPSSGIFGGYIQTEQVNRFIQLPRLDNPWETHSASAMTTHDSLGQGANSNFQNQNNSSGMLPSTSILH